MKFTPPLFLYRIYRARWMKRLWKDKMKFSDPILKVPPAIQKLGVEIVDPLDEMKPKPEKWHPPVEDPRYFEPPPITEHPLYRENPALSYEYGTKFIQKMDQACVLTKSQLFDGLPPNVTNLIDKVNVPNKEKLLQQYIMHSQEWDSTRVKLTKRFDLENLKFKIPREYGIPRHKSTHILLTELVRLCQSMAAHFPSAIAGRRLINNPYISTQYTLNGEKILIRGKPAYLIGSSEDLQPFADQQIVQLSADYILPDLGPVKPTVDLIKHHIYTDDIISGFKSPYTFSKPHTIFLVNDDNWKNIDRQCRSLMFCFAYAMTRAMEKFGADVKDLPEPVSVQCVNMDETSLNFTCFQLNTLNVSTASGIKNLAWMDSSNQLFFKHLPKPWREEEIYHIKRYDSFNPEPFDKMLAMVLNGLPELTGSL